MKIYNKKKLWSGVGSLALAVLLIVTMCIKGFRAKDIALVVVLLALGLSQVSGAMSRQQASGRAVQNTSWMPDAKKVAPFSFPSLSSSANISGSWTCIT